MVSDDAESMVKAWLPGLKTDQQWVSTPIQMGTVTQMTKAASLLRGWVTDMPSKSTAATLPSSLFRGPPGRQGTTGIKVYNEKVTTKGRKDKTRIH